MADVIFGITRVRNEELIIEDTIDHVLGLVDHIVLYDDCSTDRTLDTVFGNPDVTIIQGDYWRHDRPGEETRHRNLILNRARSMGATHCYCFDADERLLGPLPELTGFVRAAKFQLFDGYMTPDRCEPYREGKLTQLGRLWGPECREIVMYFKTAGARFVGADAREPFVPGSIILAEPRVMHFGKCISQEQHEETCDYYSNHWPEPYASKWEARKGKAIHTKSDFGRALFEWDALPDPKGDSREFLPSA